MGPKMPPTLVAPAITGYKAADFNADLSSYRAKVAAPDMAGALALRNQIAYRVMGDIEINYSKFAHLVRQELLSAENDRVHHLPDARKPEDQAGAIDH
jgi:hypothetical protein